jgi:hypothetical protein
MSKYFLTRHFSVNLPYSNIVRLSLPFLRLSFGHNLVVLSFSCQYYMSGSFFRHLSANWKNLQLQASHSFFLFPILYTHTIAGQSKKM